MTDLTERRVVAVSGGFDPLHRGHINLFLAARRLGDQLVVIVDSDDWVRRKHTLLMLQKDRVSIIRELRCVDLVLSSHSDTDVNGVLTSLNPHIYAVGPDHHDVKKIPEYETCRGLGINVICLDFLDKTRSSSNLLGAFNAVQECPNHGQCDHHKLSR